MPTTRELVVFAHLDGDWAPCGRLGMTGEGSEVIASTFAYGLRYLERANALEVDPVSLSLQSRDDVREARLYPVNELALFGGIRDAAPDAWGRRVIEARLKAVANSLPESTYLLEAGSNRVGALDVRQALDDPPRRAPDTWESLRYLMEAAARIEAGEPVPASLEAIFDAGSALGGARPKASVRDQSGVMWLAKFPSHTDRFDVPSIETAILRLAGECGLGVPPVRLINVGARPVMLIRRFDRYFAEPAETSPTLDLMATEPGAGLVEKRLGFISGLTLLACHESESMTKSYADLAHAIRRYCHPDVIRQDNRELFARMVFNILVSNDDDHLRNHGFVFDPRVRGWRLSHLYDVMPRPSMAHERLLHLGVGQQGRVATLDNAMTAKEAFSLSGAEAAEIIANVWSHVREWRVHFENDGVAGNDIEKVSTAIRHLDDVASPELRKRIP